MAARFDGRADDTLLQHQLRDLICLAVVGDHVRWVLIDDEELADWLTRAADQWRRWADQVATRLAAAGVAPDGRVRSLAEDIPLNWVPDGRLTSDQARDLIGRRLGRVTEWAEYRQSQAEGADAELLALISTGLVAQLRDRRESAEHARRERENRNAAVRAGRLRNRLRARSVSAAPPL
jgi:hypothetical protein